MSHYCVFGLGISGISVCKFLCKAGHDVQAWDDNESGRQAAASLGFDNLTISPITEDTCKDAKALVLSPGVPLTHPSPHPVVAVAKEAGIPIIADIELLYQAHPDALYIGITGTNGKSTTTTLIAHLLTSLGCDVRMGGNIGTPVLDLAPPTAGTIYVLELSSYQLDLLDHMQIDIAVWLNISPDHLDRHGSIEGYIKAKKRIFDNTATAIIGVDEGYSRAVYESLQGKASDSIAPSIIPITGYDVPCDGVFHVDETTVSYQGKTHPLPDLPHLRGRHNAQNIAAALASCEALELDLEEAIASLASFKGLEHRLELVTETDKLRIINDSKATNAHATSHALQAFDDIYWIAGGVAKEGGIESLVPFFSQITRAYFIGQAAEDFLALADKHHLDAIALKDLNEATIQALHDIQKAGKGTLLLSPACASFDQFKNFEQRGIAFKEAVKKLY